MSTYTVAANCVTITEQDTSGSTIEYGDYGDCEEQPLPLAPTANQLFSVQGLSREDKPLLVERDPLQDRLQSSEQLSKLLDQPTSHRFKV